MNQATRAWIHGLAGTVRFLHNLDTAISLHGIGWVNRMRQYYVGRLRDQLAHIPCHVDRRLTIALEADMLKLIARIEAQLASPTPTPSVTAVDR
jgi:hypothetical protein